MLIFQQLLHYGLKDFGMNDDLIIDDLVVQQLKLLTDVISNYKHYKHVLIWSI